MNDKELDAALGKRECPICFLCRKTIKGIIYYQAGMFQFPVHNKCRIVIKRSKDGGI